MAPFWGFFGLLLPQILFNPAELLTKDILQQDKHIVCKILQNFES